MKRLAQKWVALWRASRARVGGDARVCVGGGWDVSFALPEMDASRQGAHSTPFDAPLTREFFCSERRTLIGCEDDEARSRPLKLNDEMR